MAELAVKLLFEAVVRALTENHAPPAEPAALPLKTEFDKLMEYLLGQKIKRKLPLYTFNLCQARDYE